MDFDLSEEQTILQNTVRRFVQEQCPREYARELDHTGKFLEDLWQTKNPGNLMSNYTCKTPWDYDPTHREGGTEINRIL